LKNLNLYLISIKADTERPEILLHTTLPTTAILEAVGRKDEYNKVALFC
jgi:hypothetical protein